MATFTIGTATGSFDGDANGVVGGDIIYVTAGARGQLVLDNINGAAGNPVWVVNSGGRVLISGGNPAMRLRYSSYVHMTGRGHARMYGFVISGFTNTGLFVEDTEETEVDHFEIGPDSVDGAALRWYNYVDGSRVFYNISIHDMYIHEVGKEGMYIFQGDWQGGAQSNGLSVYRCTVHDTGWDGIQYRYVVNADIYRNTLWNTGQNVAGTGQRGSGIIIGPGVNTSEIRHNWLHDGCCGMYGLTFESGLHIHHNLIEAMYTDPVDSSKTGNGIQLDTDGHSILIEKNTVLDCDVYGIVTKAADVDGTIRNSIAAGNGTNISSSYTVTNNSTGTIAAQNFRASDELRHLTATSPAVGAASDGSDCGWLDYN